MGLDHPLLATIRESQAARIMTALESVPRSADRRRLAAGLDLMGDGPFHEELLALQAE